MLHSQLLGYEGCWCLPAFQNMVCWCLFANWPLHIVHYIILLPYRTVEKCRLIWYHLFSSHINSHHVSEYHIILYHIISYRIVSYHIISYHIISYHIISYIISINDRLSCYISYIFFLIFLEWQPKPLKAKNGLRPRFVKMSGYWPKGIAVWNFLPSRQLEVWLDSMRENHPKNSSNQKSL